MAQYYCVMCDQMAPAEHFFDGIHDREKKALSDTFVASSISRLGHPLDCAICVAQTIRRMY